MVIMAVLITTIGQEIVVIMIQICTMPTKTAVLAEVEKHMMENHMSPLPTVMAMAVTGTLTTRHGVVRMMTMISLQSTYAQHANLPMQSFKESRSPIQWSIYKEELSHSPLQDPRRFH
jgi:hypothetical protein